MSEQNMSYEQLRFQIVCARDGRWTVLDTESATVACFGAEVLQDLTEMQARTFSTILNEIHPPKTPVPTSSPEMPLRVN